MKLIELKCGGCGEPGVAICDDCAFWADNSIHLRNEDETMKRQLTEVKRVRFYYDGVGLVYFRDGLNSLIEKIPEDSIESARIEFVEEEDYDEVNQYAEIRYKVLETDKQEKEREHQELLRKLEAECAEKNMYLILKEKYEGKK